MRATDTHVKVHARFGGLMVMTKSYWKLRSCGYVWFRILSVDRVDTESEAELNQHCFAMV